MRKPAAPALVLALGLAGCLENEEVIEIRPDGSVRVQVSARGDAGDLGDGYAVPLGAGWRPGGADTPLWLGRVGRDTGSPEVRARLEGIDWGALGAEKEDEIRIEASAVFDSVEDWPSWYAPVEEPYRTAYLERDAHLSIVDRSGVRLYAFERTFRARRYARLDAMDRLQAELDEEILTKLDGERQLLLEEWVAVTDVLAQVMRETAEVLAREAMVTVFAQGAASLDPASVEGVVEEVLRAVDRLITPEEFAQIHAYYLALKAGEVEQAEIDPFDAKERSIRDSIRRTLNASLARRGVSAEDRNLALGRMEWVFTYLDHTDDLEDEKFVVRLRMPGTVIAGNFDEVEDGFVIWTFEAEELDQGDRVLRASSVLVR